MNLVKTIDTSGMNSGAFVEDGVGRYHVGGFVQEYEDAWKEDKAGYDLEDIEKTKN